MLRSLAVLLVLAAVVSSAVAQATVDFQRDVRPLLSRRCFACHGPDAGERKAKLRLDTADGADGAYRVRDGVAAIVPGDPVASELLRRVVSRHDDDRMPPPSAAHLPPLADAEVDVLRRWIAAGARYQGHWSFEPPAVPTLPAVADAGWSEHIIDRFVRARLEREGLAPAPDADRRTLIRRVTFDLTGLPPTRAEIAAFLADDRPDAYERLVDRLLQSPHYGEHMARYWLDLVRFADTNGMHHDHYRDLTPYRDWVIRAFRDDLPYDRFFEWQLAGDLLEDASDEQRIASGWHRLHLIIDVGTALPEESRARNVIDRVTAFGTGFLGLTVQCAQCHDHKFDPITQRDFFRLSAFFDNLDAAPETGLRRGPDFRRGAQPPYLELPGEQERAKIAAIEAEIAKIDREREAFEAAVAKERAARRQPAGSAEQPQRPAKPEQPEPDEEAASDDLDARLAARREADAQRTGKLRKQRDAILRASPAAMVMKERAEPRETRVFVRGQYDQLGERVTRGVPAFLPPLAVADGTVPTRRDLVAWLLRDDHPLTARVAVNRFWQQCFGVGLVETSEDFGAQGEAPSHPRLLDWLATTFRDSGWSVKALMRTIVTSRTYRQSSVATAAAFERDPDNRLLARGSRYRMDAEMIRDQLLVSSGLWNPEMFGRSVKPPQPAGIWRAVTLPDSLPRRFVADDGDQIWRRSIYTFWKRGLPPPQMTILNAPSREFCTARRERTNTPLQALLLLNEGQYLKAARHLALRELRVGGGDRDRVARIYEAITARLPDEREADTLLAALDELTRSYRQSPELAAKLCAEVELDGVEPTSLAAWTMVTSTVYNLDIARTRQ